MSHVTNELEEHQAEMAATDPMSVMLSGRTEHSLSEADKIARDAFCREYCKDFNAKKAMHRIGVVNPKTAATKGSIWLRERYCSDKIREMVRTLQPTDIIQRNDVLAGLLKEANDEHNEGSVRVAAWAHAGKMIGAIETATQDNSPRAPINVMLVPVSGDIGSWAQQAALAQGNLKRIAAERNVTPIPMQLPA